VYLSNSVDTLNPDTVIEFSWDGSKNLHYTMGSCGVDRPRDLSFQGECKI
jgi:hypothetical protein